jgi:hypothetical protein
MHLSKEEEFTRPLQSRGKFYFKKSTISEVRGESRVLFSKQKTVSHLFAPLTAALELKPHAILSCLAHHFCNAADTAATTQQKAAGFSNCLATASIDIAPQTLPCCT